MAEISRPLNVYFLPFLAQGHMIPFCQFARLFAARGLHVTIITTPVNARFLQSSIEESNALGHHIQLHTVRFPSDEVGLPDGIENFFNVTDAPTGHKLYEAAGLLRNQVQPFMEENPPDCIVSDFMYPWTAPIATRLGIPRIVFNSFCLFAVCMISAHNRQLQSLPPGLCNDHDGDNSGGPFVVSGLPETITLPLRPPKRISELLGSLIEADQKNSYGLIVNNFNDLDGQDYINYHQKSTDLKVWHIGPASLMLRNILPKEDLHPQTNNEHDELIRTWLDSKESNSVVYVSFGSLCRFDDPQLFEIACGLESSGCSFIWVVHRESKQNNEEEEEAEEKKTWLPKGFEGRMKKENRGLILMKWAPQELILNHPATGGFLTHCGWTTVTEAVSAGVPMMTWPVFVEQFYNEKLITQVHGFGVEVGAEEWNSGPYDRRTRW
ncbi:UDP-glucose flavonoid 3-O-glucosyltransferase 7-like [Neltuma alba]|uniref:UDP-glucose flavonoid 3-O-glucosyltransferase 7-like n=1 Tax=Neltuma alba TaxID=207710 RepID=UPI0010A48741|nr:UDP-glucose flavonoid 3-O-glucosyltransferase 7-like [Prosopis alba]